MKARPSKDLIYAQFARIAKALGNAKRLEVLDLLAQAPRHVEALATETGMSVASVSQHLQVLRHAGLVECERQGTKMEYQLADESVLRLWLDLRSVAESRLAELTVAFGLMKGDRVTAPRLRNPKIPKAISDIVMKAMAPQIHDRYQRASELLDDVIAARGLGPRRLAQGRPAHCLGQKGSRPMKPSSLVWVSAPPGTSTRAPYWPEERRTCSICSIPPRS